MHFGILAPMLQMLPTSLNMNSAQALKAPCPRVPDSAKKMHFFGGFSNDCIFTNI
jgi:hypothetical protein